MLSENGITIHINTDWIVAIERLMNELGVCFWLDALLLSNTIEVAKVKVQEDFERMCPGVIWEWEGNKIKVTGFRSTAKPSSILQV